MRRQILATLLLAVASPVFASGGEKSKATADAEAIQKRGTASQVYLASAPVSATLTENFRVKGLLQVDAGFDIPNDKLRARAAQMAPVIRDAMREALSRYASVFQRPGGVPDTDRIKAMLQAAADKALGQQGARLVLVSVMVHEGR
ncbi:MAG: hypothetical protein ABWZ40_01020 [Caulobacterales bacterium]